MKTYLSASAACAVLCLFLSLPANAADTATYAVSVGPRIHSDHSTFIDLPYGDNDIGYDLALEAHDEDGYARLGVEYAPDVSGIDGTDFVITPHIDIIYQDRIFIGGVGLLDSYVNNSTGDDWTGIYWQLNLGLSFNFEVITVAAQAYYTFDKWGDISDFETKDLEYGATIAYNF